VPSWASTTAPTPSPSASAAACGSAPDDVTEITAAGPVWTGCDPPDHPRDCLVQLRAHGEIHPCTAWLDGDDLRICLHHPARGVARGQAAVLYDGDKVLGSATISATLASALANVSAETP